MSDLISRASLIEEIKNDLALKYTGDVSANFISGMITRQYEIVDIINDRPTVEAVPVVHGEWKRVGSGSLYDVYECTNCHCPPKWDCLGDNHWKIAFTDFCPHCGADMRKKV